MIEAVFSLSPLNSSDALHLNCIHFHVGSTDQSRRRIITDLFNPFQRMFWKRKHALLTNIGPETKPADSVETETDLAVSTCLLSPGSSDTLTAVIHMAVLTWEQEQGVLLPFPVSHHSGPKVCLDMPFPAPLSPATPSTCLQKNHSSFKSHTSRNLWKDAAICFVLFSVNMY